MTRCAGIELSVKPANSASEPRLCCEGKQSPAEAGCSQEEGPKKGFVMGSRTQGVQEILEKCM